MSAAPRILLRVGCLAVLLLSLGTGARADDLFLGDLMDHRIAITTGFAGTDVFIYGVKQGPGDVVVVFRGPRAAYAVRRKERIAGIWLNTDRVDFQGVPTFYAVASSKPLDEVVSPKVQATLEIGVDHLKQAPADEVDASDVVPFADALVRVKKSMGLYQADVANITLDNRPLFSGRVHFPANVPTGNYEVTVMLFNGGEMVTGNSAVLQVSKGGADAWIYERAHDQAAAYGLCAIAGALLLGWAAHLVFRKI
jgi:uncharacterized protein (TIGR02186 family)